MPHHRVFAGIVGGKRQVDVVVEHTQQVPQVLGTANQVLPRVECIRDTIAFRGIRHELHQADRPLLGHRLRVVARFDRDHGMEQRAFQPVDAGHLIYNRVVGEDARIGLCRVGSSSATDGWAPWGQGPLGCSDQQGKACIRGHIAE